MKEIHKLKKWYCVVGLLEKVMHYMTPWKNILQQRGGNQIQARQCDIIRFSRLVSMLRGTLENYSI